MPRVLQLGHGGTWIQLQHGLAPNPGFFLGLHPQISEALLVRDVQKAAERELGQYLGMMVLKDTYYAVTCEGSFCSTAGRCLQSLGLLLAFARGMFGLSQLSSLQFPAFTISAAGQEVWEGDII